MKRNIPAIRVVARNSSTTNDSGRYVLYWMIASRRTAHNFALDHAIHTAKEHGVGLVVLEALRVGYQWASDRLHAFVIDGMADNARALEDSPVRYYPYVEPTHSAGRGLLEALAANAVCVVTDEFPCFFLPRMVEAASKRLSVRLETVDSNGIYPLAATERVFTTAASFRRHLQKEIAPHLGETPNPDPLSGLELPASELDEDALAKWPATNVRVLSENPAALSSLPIDHSVEPVAARGGRLAGLERLEDFIDHKLASYPERNHPDDDTASGLSPYLHFGFVSVHEIFSAVMASDGWDPSRIAPKATGSRSGWWGASSAVEAFLDELITWREIGFNMCHKRDDYAEFDSLPEWARETMAEHASDERPELYTLEELARSETADPIWNAAQNQLRETGVVHNYLRMLWGKKIFEWSATPREALARLIELNNRYAIDGRNPNSYSGIFWVLGRYDRAWGPERDIYGKIRYMTSAQTKRKLRMKGYLERFGAAPVQPELPLQRSTARVILAPMSYPIEEIEGIGPANAAKLAKAEITNTEHLLSKCADPSGRKSVGEATGFDPSTLLKWANMADLMRIKGVGEEYSELLEAAGVDTIKELRNRNAANLAAKMEEVNGEKSLTRKVPSENMLSEWIEQAKSLDPILSY